MLLAATTARPEGEILDFNGSGLSDRFSKSLIEKDISSPESGTRQVKFFKGSVTLKNRSS
jgi:hypothetical protein